MDALRETGTDTLGRRSGPRRLPNESTAGSLAVSICTPSADTSNRPTSVELQRLRSVCRPPTALQSLPFSPSLFVSKSRKLHNRTKFERSVRGESLPLVRTANQSINQQRLTQAA
jgi:hypothetical protein